VFTFEGGRCKTSDPIAIIAQIDLAQAASKTAAPLGARILEIKANNSYNKNNTALHRNIAERKVPTFQRIDSTYWTRRRRIFLIQRDPTDLLISILRVSIIFR
jgi:hypothetical protein